MFKITKLRLSECWILQSDNICELTISFTAHDISQDKNIVSLKNGGVVFGTLVSDAARGFIEAWEEFEKAEDEK